MKYYTGQKVWWTGEYIGTAAVYNIEPRWVRITIDETRNSKYDYCVEDFSTGEGDFGVLESSLQRDKI